MVFSALTAQENHYYPHDLDIIQPDTGSVTWKGKPFSRHPQGTFGYLPEERGLYPKMRVEEHLIFLARLNGLSKHDAVQKRKL